VISKQNSPGRNTITVTVPLYCDVSDRQERANLGIVCMSCLLATVKGILFANLFFPNYVNNMKDITY